MKNSTQLSLYSAEQLPTLLIAHPTFKFIGLKVDKEVQLSVLHSIYIEKEDISDEPSFRSLLTIADWGGQRESEAFFLEALTAEHLIEKLQHFDGSNAFVFFQIPSSVTIDTVNMLPQPMFCKLFPELGEFDNQLSPELLLQLEEKSLVLLTALERRFKNQ